MWKFRCHCVDFVENALTFADHLCLRCLLASSWWTKGLLSRIPYSGKLSREKTFTNLAILLPPVKFFSTKYGCAVPTYDRFQHSVKVFSACELITLTDLRKFFPSKVYCYTVCRLVIVLITQLTHHWLSTMLLGFTFFTKLAYMHTYIVMLHITQLCAIACAHVCILIATLSMCTRSTQHH